MTPSDEQFTLEFKPDVKIGEMYASSVSFTVPSEHVKKFKYVFFVNSTDLNSRKVFVARLEIWKGQIVPENPSTLNSSYTVTKSLTRSHPSFVFLPTVAGIYSVLVLVHPSDGSAPSRFRMSLRMQPIATLRDEKPTAADLESTESTPVPMMFKRMARQMGGDVKSIFRYVRDNVLSDTYWAVMRGSLRTYYDLYGNSFDQASLLVALLRGAGIPARYVYGVVGVKSEVVMDSLGLWHKPTLLKILELSHLLDHYDREDDKIWLRHMWVKAYVNNTWLELDPFFKKVIRRPHSLVNGVVGSPFEQFSAVFENMVADYLKPLSQVDQSDYAAGVWIVTDENYRVTADRLVLYIGSEPPEGFVATVRVSYPRWSEARYYDFRNGNYSFDLAMPVAAGYRLTARIVPADSGVISYLKSLPNGITSSGIDVRRAKMRVQFLLNGMIISVGDAGYAGYTVPVHLRVILKNFDNTTAVKESQNHYVDGYVAFVPSFFKTRGLGELGVYSASVISLTQMPPHLLRGVDVDETFGRLAYMQARLMRIGEWNIIEKLHNFSYVFKFPPLAFTQGVFHTLSYDGRRVVVGAPYVHAGDWNQLYLIAHPENGEIELTPEIVMQDHLTSSMMEGISVYRIHGMIPFSTAHALYFAGKRGIPILYTDKNNITVLRTALPRGIYDRILNLAQVYQQIKVYVPNSYTNFDILSIYATNVSVANPPTPTVASDVFAYYYIIPRESPYGWGFGTIIQKSPDVIAGGGGGSISEANKLVGQDMADKFSQNTKLATGTDEVGEEAGIKIASNFDPKLAAEIERLMAEARKAREAGDLAKAEDLSAQALALMMQLGDQLSKDVLKFQLLYASLEGNVPVLKKPDGSLMSYSEATRLLLELNLPQSTINEILENQQKWLNAYSLGYVEHKMRIDDKEYAVRFYYKQAAEYAGQGLPPLNIDRVEVSRTDGKALGNFKADNWDLFAMHSLTKLKLTPQQGQTESQLLEKIEDAVSKINDYNGKSVQELMSNYREKTGVQGEFASELISSGVIFFDPPFVEFALEDPSGNIVGYHPSYGTVFAGNGLRYSGYGSYPKILETFGNSPGLYLLNIYGTQNPQTDLYLYITFNLGNVDSFITVPVQLKVRYGELVKIPIIIDQYYRVRVDEPKPAMFVNFTVDPVTVGDSLVVRGKVLDNFGRRGVKDANVTLSFFTPDGKIETIRNVFTDEKGQFSVKYAPRLGGVYHVHALAIKQGFAPSTYVSSVYAHAKLTIEGSPRFAQFLAGKKIILKLEGGKTGIPLQITEKGTSISLPAGKYEITFPSLSDESGGWKVQGKESTVKVTLSGTYSVSLETLYETYVLISARANVGTVEGTGYHRVGTQVSLKATAPTEYLFKGWQGDIESTRNPLVFTATKPVNLEAVWEIRQQTTPTTRTEMTPTTTRAETTPTTPTVMTTTQTRNTTPTVIQTEKVSEPSANNTIIIAVIAATAISAIAAAAVMRRGRKRPLPPPPPTT
ncbi:MAG: transglutaminase domain-containing protein [Candidatus Caldarchaeum sp.]|nr:transglutaminase domain-containing protein [Candidatus Caldarchaeum sp.]